MNERSHAGSCSSLGLILAALGVTAFSLTSPGTVRALTVALRSVLAALPAGGCLLALRIPVPARAHRPGPTVVAAGVVAGTIRC
ncbi:hypothetical protein GCM10020256_63920 [Streptomyces thermocoprophilus]